MRRAIPVLLIMAATVRAATNAVVHDLGEIVVEGTPISRYHAERIATATWTETPPEELPLTVEVLTEDFIGEVNPGDLHDLLRHQAGIYTGGKSMLDRTSGQYTLRGMAGSEPMFDGTLGLPGAMGIHLDPAALERIEVVKGPVGATVGGATSTMGPYGAGGSVNLVLKQPLTDRSFHRADARATFGDEVQRYRLVLDLNEPFAGEDLALRLPFAYDTGKPFRMPGSYSWRQSLFAAPALLWAPDDDLRLGLNTTIQYTEQPGYQGIPIYRGRPLQGFDWDSCFGERDLRDRYAGGSAQAWLEWRLNDIWQLRTGAGFAQADVDFEHLGAAAFANPDGSLYSPAYLAKPHEYSWGDTTSRRCNFHQRATATFATGPLSHTALLQGDFTRKETEGWSYFGMVSSPDAGRRRSPANRQDTAVERYGALAQEQLAWGKLRLLGGGRLDRHESDLGNDAGSFSPRAGLSLPATERVILYGNLSRTEAPNFGYLKGPGEELTSSWKATQREAGLRLAPLPALWLSAAVFQIDQEDTPTLAPGSSFYETEGETRTRGVELSLVGNIRDNWSAYTSYAVLDYEDKSSGKSFDRHPPHAVTASTSYRIEGGPLDNIVLGLAYRYRHSYAATMRGAYVGDDFFIDSSHVFDCSADLPLDKFGGPRDVVLRLALKNIFNERYVESNRHYYQCFPGDPRLFEIALRASF
jgi:iron complex outermembrane receptor protein